METDRKDFVLEQILVKEAYIVRPIPDLMVRMEDGRVFRRRANGVLDRTKAFDRLDLSIYGVKPATDTLAIYGVAVR